MSQYHLDATSYLRMVTADVADYEEFQDRIAEATAVGRVQRILDLGTGTGVTAQRVLDLHPAATLVGLDSSPEMLAVAAAELDPGRVKLLERRLEDSLPDGPFDVVVTALAVHHLTPAEKLELFARVARVLRPSGRFVLGDVTIPADPGAARIPLEVGVDLPDTTADLLRWLTDAGLLPEVVWERHDLAVITADRPGATGRP